MLGIKSEIHLSQAQKKLVDSWIAAQNGVYNAKVEEEDYFYRFERSSLSLTGTRPKTDAAYSHLVSPWMRKVPSQILRNGACRYYEAKQRFFSKLAKHPRKKKGLRRSCRVTNELFIFKQTAKKAGIKAEVSFKQIGKIFLDLDSEIRIPKMLTLSRTGGRYFLSFCYDDQKKVRKQADVYEELRVQDPKEIRFLGVDRGVKIQSACSDGTLHSFTVTQQEQLKRKMLRKRRFQRKLARQQMGSQNRNKTKQKLSKISAKIANIRKNFNHHVSKKIVNSDAQVLVFEALKLKNMTRSARGSCEQPGKQVAAKSGLNRAILDCNLGQQLEFVKYKAIREGKLVLRVNPKGSSIECRKCAHSDPNNRMTQESFQCLRCGHTEHADVHAAKVVAQRGFLDFVSGKIEFLDQSKKKVKTARRRREDACGEDMRQVSQSAVLAASVNQELELSSLTTEVA
jgi:putative transposase